MVESHNNCPDQQCPIINLYHSSSPHKKEEIKTMVCEPYISRAKNDQALEKLISEFFKSAKKATSPQS